MPTEKSQEPMKAPSVLSDDQQSSSNFSKIRKAGLQTGRDNGGGRGNGIQAHRLSSEGQGLEARIAEILQSEEWDSRAQADPARSSLLSQMRMQLKGSLGALYMQDFEAGVNLDQSQSQEHLLHRHGPDPDSSSSRSIAEFISQSHLPLSNGQPIEWRLEVKRLTRVEGRTGSVDVYESNQKIEDIRRREREFRGGGYVLNAYDVYDSEGSEGHTILEVTSPPLTDVLRDLIRFFPGDEFDSLKGRESLGDTLAFPDPYMMFFSYRKQLEQSQQQEYPEDAKAHVGVLLDFLKHEHPVWSSALTEIEEGTCDALPFHALWLLYPPNTSVYVCEGLEDRQQVVYFRTQAFAKSTTGATKGPDGALTIRCWDVKYDHGAFRRTFSDFVIEPYSGKRKISKLPLVPARFMHDEEEVRNRLIARGRKYFELKQAAQLQDYYGDRFPRVYKDVSVLVPDLAGVLTAYLHRPQEPVRVIVDEDTYRRKAPYEAPLVEKDSAGYGFPAEEESLLDEYGSPLDTTLLRCFPELGVFSLRDRQWGKQNAQTMPILADAVLALVKVYDLQPVDFRQKAYGKLVMKREYKGLLKALVKAYMMENAFFRDIVPGKGRGLAILLHGPPGTGKTLTAGESPQLATAGCKFLKLMPSECVAEREQRPLYTISCGDLGTEPEQLEVKLKEVFEYAVLWKAILLLDEADIFLQERNVNDLKRNALVTIFLRELEYFDGIIFVSIGRNAVPDGAEAYSRSR